VKLVKQEDACGCAVACIAMVTNRTYQSVRADFENDFTKEGIYTDQILNYLTDAGFSAVLKQIHGWLHKDFYRKEMLKPFAPLHVVSLKPRADSRNHHMVAMDAKGKLHCPSGEWTDKEIREGSYLIETVIGLFK
jgi:hypothetical protein